MIEDKIKIEIKGVSGKLATEIGTAISELITWLNVNIKDIDLRRMHHIIVTSDFSGELAELSKRTASGNSITYTNEEYAVAVAKVMILPRGEEYEIILIINANIASALVTENPEGYQSDIFKRAVHFVHHELSHVHDINKKYDASNKLIFKYHYRGKDRLIRPLADNCWSEYIADYLSASTANDYWLKEMTNSLSDSIEWTKVHVDKEIIEYHFHGDLIRLMDEFHRHGYYLIKIAANILGFMDGLDKRLIELSTKAYDNLCDSYFEPIWNAMQTALWNMHRLYPEGWKDLSIYDSLANVIECYYSCMGLILSENENGEIYVTLKSIP
jgi:hypothetical protein